MEREGAAERTCFLPHFYRMENILMRLTNESRKKMEQKIYNSELFSRPATFILPRRISYFHFFFCTDEEKIKMINEWEKGCNHNQLFCLPACFPANLFGKKDLN